MDSGRRPRFSLPWNYHLSVQSAIYDALDRYAPKVATELHQLPHDPPFAFGEFVATAPYDVGDEGISFDQGLLPVTSDRTEILEAIASHATGGDLTLGHTTLPVVGTDLEPTHGVGMATYRTMSPVCVSRNTDGEREYLRPDSGAWHVRLYESVRDRLEGEWGLPDEFEFSVESIEWSKPKRLRVGGGWANCTRFEATIRTDRTTSEFIQQHGLGERTGMGFGCVIPIDHLPEAIV